MMAGLVILLVLAVLGTIIHQATHPGPKWVEPNWGKELKIEKRKGTTFPDALKSHTLLCGNCKEELDLALYGGDRELRGEAVKLWYEEHGHRCGTQSEAKG